MAVQNTFSVIIDGINYTRKAVFPIKSANLLDERLDECYLSLRHMKRKEFKPLTFVQITYHNRVYCGRGENEKVIYRRDEPVRYFIANDNANESPVGSGLWNHDLYLIELTKYLEMIVVDSLTFTNDLGKDYLKDMQKLVPFVQDAPTSDAPAIIGSWSGVGQVFTPDRYVGPLKTGATISIGSIDEIFYPIGSVGFTIMGNCSLQIKHNNTILFQTSNKAESYNLVLSNSGTYEVVYTAYTSQDKTSGGSINKNTQAFYTFNAVSNQYPLKRLTCTDVINRLLELAEPLRLGEKPQFALNQEQAEQFDQIYAPQFSFTRQTLRECLQEVGKVLHGEPRLKLNNGRYEIFYDMYGGTKRSFVGRCANIYHSTQKQIESYCSSIDSTAQNLINQTDWAAGVICEPNSSNFKTLRTETQYVRITDENMMIATDRPIYQIQKLEVLGSRIGAMLMPYAMAKDITPYVVESTIYNSQLSSYSEAYPYSKAFGIYFTQGEKNIKGLNFKVEHAVDTSVFSNYAIANILKREADITPEMITSYPALAFRVTYIPYFDVRVAQTKSYYKDFDQAVALVYNQSANTIESKYCGENLKGVVARLGNTEKTITYNLTRWSQIPKAGELYDDDYYISAVSVEFLPSYIKCTIGLSKDFNRLNEYIGVSSEKRYYEISERQTYDRSILYHEYIVIGDEEQSDDTIIGIDFMNAVADTFTQEGDFAPLTSVTTWGGTYSYPVSTMFNGEQTSPLPCVQLPVISTAFGNSMSFVWNYQDNYSASSYSQQQANGGVSGYWQNDYQYTDYYGRIYYLNFDVNKTGNANSLLILQSHISQLFPSASYPSERSNYLSTRQKPYTLRKDSREIPQINVQVEFVTNRQDLIIGSALASSCGLIRGSDTALKAHLYVLDTPINKFTTVLSAIPEMTLKGIPEPVAIEVSKDSFSDKFYMTSADFTVENLSAFTLLPGNYVGPIKQYVGKSWVIVTNQTSELQTVEDEYGNVTQQVISKGGEILLAKNGEVNVGDNIGEIWFTPKRRIFDKTIA